MAYDPGQGAVQGGLSGGMAGASFGPIGMAVGAAAGIGFSLWGGSKSYNASKAYNEAQVAQIQEEKKQAAMRMQRDELLADRMKRENMRAVQQKTAQGLAAFVNQGGGDIKSSSGLAGSRAQQTSEGNWNELGVNQSLYFARDLFASNQRLSDARIAQANAGMEIQTGNAISSFGSGISSNLGQIGRLSSGWGSSSNKNYSGNSGMGLSNNNSTGSLY